MAFMSTTLPSFADLTPFVVLDALASLALIGDGRLMALNSFENRVYLAHLEHGTRLADSQPAIVVKFYRPGRWSMAQLEEEHAFARELADDDVPVVAPLSIDGRTLHRHAGFHFSVSPLRGGRRPELEQRETLAWIGRFIARLHNVGARRPFAHRPAVDVQSHAIEPRTWLLAQGALPLEVEREWATVSQNAIELIASSALCSGADDGFESKNRLTTTLRLHGDCHPGNILWTPTDRPGGGPHFVDLDDCRSGPAMQDLWMLLSGEPAQRQRQLRSLLEGYEQIRAFDRRELALVEPLRTLRLIHYSVWLARRWHDPAFAPAFPEFGTLAYWREQIQALDSQIEAMLAPPLIA